MSKQQEPETPQQAAAAMNITMEQLETLLTRIITEVKKPTALEQKKLDEQDRRDKIRLQNKLKEQVAFEQARKTRFANCRHGSFHPGTGAFKHAWVGQVTSGDNHLKAMCQQCLTVIDLGPASPGHQNGVDLHRLPGLDVKQLETWAAQAKQAVNA